MIHEPECDWGAPSMEPLAGLLFGHGGGCDSCERLRRAYRRGYNDHATSQAVGYQMYGIPANQHGQGQNP